MLTIRLPVPKFLFFMRNRQPWVSHFQLARPQPSLSGRALDSDSAYNRVWEDLVSAASHRLQVAGYTAWPEASETEISSDHSDWMNCVSAWEEVLFVAEGCDSGSYLCSC